MEQVACPVCHRIFVVEDIHRPFRCPYCGSLLDMAPPDWKPRVLMRFEDMMGDER